MDEDLAFMTGDDDPLGVDENLTVSSLDTSDLGSSGLMSSDLLKVGTQLLTGLASKAPTPAQSAPLAPLQGQVVSTTSNNTLVWALVALVAVVILYKVL